ncbi:MAG TPA: hypothetical protein VD757_01960, partial [Candidatus Nitrosocosmicus sp.]|nr:hypothetical protein [Candidatus Nitrosocosmicus sp.]
QIHSNPYNMFRLNTIMQMYDGTPRFVNYPSERMVAKAGKDKSTWIYMKALLDLIEQDTGMIVPHYARG